MSKSVIIYESEDAEDFEYLIECLRRMLKDRNEDTEEICIMPGEASSHYAELICDEAIGEIYTLDMAGFQVSTIMGGPAYNVLAAKSMHIIIHNVEIWDYFRTQDMALNLFFCLPAQNDDFNTNVRFPNTRNAAFYRSFIESGDGRIAACEENKMQLFRLLEHFWGEIA